MRDLIWVRKQGQIVEREKKKMRQQVHLPLKEKLDWYAEVYEAFEQRLDDTESVFGPMRISETHLRCSRRMGFCLFTTPMG